MKALFQQPGLLLAAIGILVSASSQADFNHGGQGPNGFQHGNFGGQGGFVPPPPPPPGFGNDNHDWQNHDWQHHDGGNFGGGRGDDHGGRGDDHGGRGDDRGDGRGAPGVSRICFYDQPNYQGNTFCMNQGQQLASLVPSGWNDRIASVSVEGDISAVIYNDINYANGSYNVTQSVPNLISAQVYFGVSSIIVAPARVNPFPGNDDHRGGDQVDNRAPKICFFDQPYFRGNSFCMTPGQSNANLVPSGWNDRIQSFSIEGHVEAVLWNDVGPHGANVNVTASNPVLQLGWGVSAIQVLQGPTNPFGR